MRPDRRRSAAVLAVALLLGAAFGLQYTHGQSASAPAGARPGASPADYTCPMHPQIHADHPGDCPICGMKLVKKPGEAPARVSQGQAIAPAATGRPATPLAIPGSAGQAGEPAQGAVTLSPQQRMLANVATAPVTRRSLAHRFETTGRVTYDESRLQRVSAWTAGRIDRLYVNTTGASIMRGMTLASLYSPELLASQQEYLTALKGARELAHAPYPELRAGARDLAHAARQRLRLLGVTPAQIALLEARQQPSTSIAIVAPSSGIVIERKVLQGQYVNTGDTLYNVADLSRVWVEANVFEADIAAVHPGQLAEVRVSALANHVFHGRVALVLPSLEAATRTTKVRIELANPRGELKPDMYGSISILASAGSGKQLAVPASAVIDTGRHAIVYVEVAPNRFVPRTIAVGAKTGDYYPVVTGLREGERVAVSGGFLLDASAQLEGQDAGSRASSDGEASPGSQPSAALRRNMQDRPEIPGDSAAQGAPGMQGVPLSPGAPPGPAAPAPHGASGMPGMPGMQNMPGNGGP